MIAENYAAASVNYKRFILNADGSVHREFPWKKNLILNQGLDNVAAMAWVKSFEYAMIGTGALVTRRDSGGITFTTTAGAVVASAGFFVSGDVGRKIKFNDGPFTEATITAYTDASHVTVSPAVTVAANSGTVWYVNLTGLVTQTKNTSTYSTSAGDCGSTFTGATGTWLHQRTFIFAAEVGTVTYTEIGWGWAATSVFGLDTIAGAGDTLVAGQQYKVIVQLSVALSPYTPTAVSDVGNNGFVTAGTACLESAYVMATVNSAGASGAATQCPAEPSVGVQQVCFNATWTQQNMTTTGAALTSYQDNIALAQVGYSSGTFTRTRTYTYPVGAALMAGNFYGVGMYDANSQRGWSLKFTSPQTKDSSHTLQESFTATPGTAPW